MSTILLLPLFLMVMVALEGLGVSKGLIEVKHPVYAALFLVPIIPPLVQALVSVRRGEYVWACAAFAIAWVWFILFAVRFHAPARDVWTAETIGRTLREVVNDHSALSGFGFFSDGISFYDGYDIPLLRV